MDILQLPLFFIMKSKAGNAKTRNLFMRYWVRGLGAVSPGRCPRMYLLNTMTSSEKGTERTFV